MRLVITMVAVLLLAGEYIRANPADPVVAESDLIHVLALDKETSEKYLQVVEEYVKDWDREVPVVVILKKSTKQEVHARFATERVPQHMIFIEYKWDKYIDKHLKKILRQLYKGEDFRDGH